jgi:hypothetical protein
MPTLYSNSRYGAMLGRDGWMYQAGIDDIELTQTGRKPLTEADLAQWRNGDSRRRQWLEERGTKFLFFVVPDKASVHPEHLPEDYALSENRPLRQLLAELGRFPSGAIATPLDVLLEAKSRHVLHAKTDEHWTDRGALIGARYMERCVQALGLDYHLPDESRIDAVTKRNVRDLGALLPEPFPEAAEHLVLRDPQARELLNNGKMAGRGKFQLFETQDRARPSCVMLRDSFAKAMMPFISEGFSRLVAVSSRLMLYDLIEAERPDIVILQCVERYLTFLPDDENSRSFERMANVPLSDLRIGSMLDRKAA